MMTLVQSYLTKSDCYKAKKNMVIKGVMLGSVCCPQPSAKVLCNNWNRAGKRLCVHALIDANDGKVYNTLPWATEGAFCYGSKNTGYIGVMMCEPVQIRYISGQNFIVNKGKDLAIEAVKRTYKSAVELVGQLCVKYKLDPFTSVCSRCEAFEKGIAGSHIDPEHLWNGLELGYTMDGFRKDVSDEMRRISGKEEDAAKTSTEVGPPVKEQKIRIDIDNLWIRLSPGGEISGKYTGKGTFVITEIVPGSGTKNGWGKLQNGSGWVSLDYVTML